MRTKKQIEQLLASAGLRPSKRLGQHFLIDLNLMRLLIDSANIKSNDVVLEVGCATGSLTEGLSQRAGKVIAVEVDRALFEIAKKQLAKVENVEIINADILENKSTISQVVADAIERAREKYSGRDPALQEPRILLVANLPYSIASAVMLNLVTGPVIADGMYVTVQREVASRMTAAPGSKGYGSLSIYLCATGEVKMIRLLKPTAFWPQPQVDSAMVSFVHQKEKSSQIQDMSLLAETVSLFMSHRRKMLKSCIKFAHGELAKISNWPEIFEQCCIDWRRRPEQLRPQDYVDIANRCCRVLKP